MNPTKIDKGILFLESNEIKEACKLLKEKVSNIDEVDTYINQIESSINDINYWGPKYAD